MDIINTKNSFMSLLNMSIVKLWQYAFSSVCSLLDNDDMDKKRKSKNYVQSHKALVLGQVILLLPVTTGQKT